VRAAQSPGLRAFAHFFFYWLGLASELLLGRYALEPPRYPDSLLAQHESGLFSELRAALSAAPGHRSTTYDREVLPHSLPLVLAIGHRIAYDAARAAQVDAPLLDLFEVSAVLQDEAWYVESLGISRAELRRREAHALEAVFARLEEYLVTMDVAPYIVAPIVSDEKWGEFFGTLPTLSESREVQDEAVKKILTMPFVESNILRKISGECDTALQTVPGVGISLKA
jgi:acyl-CoA oxidase